MVVVAVSGGFDPLHAGHIKLEAVERPIMGYGNTNRQDGDCIMVKTIRKGGCCAGT